MSDILNNLRKEIIPLYVRYTSVAKVNSEIGALFTKLFVGDETLTLAEIDKMLKTLDAFTTVKVNIRSSGD